MWSNNLRVSKTCCTFAAQVHAEGVCVFLGVLPVRDSREKGAMRQAGGGFADVMKGVY